MIDATGPDGLPAAIARIAHLAPGLLIALYESSIGQVSLHLHPQVVHFELPDVELCGYTNSDGVVDISSLTAAAGSTDSGELAWVLQAPMHRARFHVEA